MMNLWWLLFPDNFYLCSLKIDKGQSHVFDHVLSICTGGLRLEVQPRCLSASRCSLPLQRFEQHQSCSEGYELLQRVVGAEGSI